MREESMVSVTFDNKRLVEGVCYDLEELAEAASKLGMNRMAETIFDSCDRLRASAQHVINAHGQQLSKDLGESQRAVGDTLVALFKRADKNTTF